MKDEDRDHHLSLVGEGEPDLKTDAVSSDLPLIPHHVLRAAVAPRAIEPEDNEALLALALGGEVVVSDEERVAAERLRRALDGEGTDSLAEFAFTLRAALCDRDLDQFTGERLLKRVTAQQPVPQPERRRRLSATSVMVGSLTAAAAGVALWFGLAGDSGPDRGMMSEAPRPEPPAAVLVRSRSAESLFDSNDPFAVRGDQAARADKIASARLADLRDNRFKRWGVR